MKIVIMAGGSGTRFWPKSRTMTPKQCIPITAERTMIEETVRRLSSLSSDMTIVTGPQVGARIKELLPHVEMIIEPLPRSTAAAIGLAAIRVDRPDDILVVETADHVYRDERSYLSALQEGAAYAAKGDIVLVGIKPTFAHTGLGYIQAAQNLQSSPIKISKVGRFVEKPEEAEAEQMVEASSYLWNAGIFISRADVMLDAMKTHMPTLFEALMAIKQDPSVIADRFATLESVSIDYGVMEKAVNTAVIHGDFHWDDVGDWLALERVFEKDSRGNVIRGEHRGSAKDSIIVADDRPIVTKGIEGLIIVDTPDCLLVCRKERAQDVRQIVARLKEDPDLERFAEEVGEPVPAKLLIDCSGVEIDNSGLTAGIGLGDLSIRKDDEQVLVEQR